MKSVTFSRKRVSTSVSHHKNKKQRIEKEENLGVEIENPYGNSGSKSPKISLALTLSLPGSFKEEEKGENSVLVNKTEKQSIENDNKVYLSEHKEENFGMKIENPEENSRVNSPKISLNLTLSLPSSISEKSDSQEENKGNNNQILNEINWTETKNLKPSDVGPNQSRLLLRKNFVEEQIIPYFGESIRDKISKEEGGQPIILKDCDRDVEVTLLLKMWKSKSYVLTSGWKKHIVDEKNLKVGDEIGLKWDNNSGKLLFGLLERGNIEH